MPDATPDSFPKREPVTAFTTPRLMSVDALRGFDMFWIIGADGLFNALNRMANGGAAAAPESTKSFSLAAYIVEQLEHVDWAGFHFEDLIFPLFVFIMGVSMVFSLTKQIAVGGRGDALKRLFRRFVLLFVVALLYSGGSSNPWPDIRLLGVLNRIALCYLFGSLIFIFFKPKAMAAIAVGLLVGYWALMNFVPIRNIQLANSHLAKMAADAGDENLAASFREEKNISTIRDHPAWLWTKVRFNSTAEKTSGKFEPGLNLANHLDFQYLPGKKWDTYYDPEGLLSTIPAIATCLFGAFAGLLLRSVSQSDKSKLVYLFSFGIASVLLGFLWGHQFPVVKKIWSSSFVLVAGGYSAILL
ncbi:MAG: heparan-alpha-glucosaminide N-acetyltransferase domain-containing protein, partial [Verrucomicrobiota bacterium]